MTTITVTLDTAPLEAMARKLNSTVEAVVEMLLIEVETGMIPATETEEDNE